MVHRITRGRIILEIILLFVLPVVLLYLGIIPIEHRFLVLAIVVLVILRIVIKERWGFKELGIRFDNIKQTIIPYTIFTIIGISLIALLATFLDKNIQREWWTKPHFLGLFIPISLVQEFIFRGFLIPRLKTVFRSYILVILTNSLLFTVLHIIYPNPMFLLVAFIGGFGFAAMYYFYPNLILISISHMVLNFFTVLYCIFSFIATC